MVILRLHTSRSFGGRSACMSCQSTLRWYELVPVFSYLFIGGRCLNCDSKISAQYPLVELSTGFIFGALFMKFWYLFFLDILSFSLTYAFYAAAFSLLIVIVGYDMRHKIIPDIAAFVLAALAFVGLFLFDSYGFNPHIPQILEFFSGIIVAAPFALFWLISRGRWMGLGDAKLAIGLGWLFGLSRALSGIVVAFWAGAGVGILLLIFSKKHGMKSEIPFAPFLVLGTLLAFFFELRLFGI